MTNREFLIAITTASVSDELKEFATAELAKLDAKNEKRRNTPSKEQIANEALKNTILDLLAVPHLASELATACGVSTQKVSALCGQLVKEGRATVADFKVKGKGTVKQYRAVDGDDTNGEVQALPNELSV